MGNDAAHGGQRGTGGGEDVALAGDEGGAGVDLGGPVEAVEGEAFAGGHAAGGDGLDQEHFAAVLDARDGALAEAGAALGDQQLGPALEEAAGGHAEFLRDRGLAAVHRVDALGAGGGEQEAGAGFHLGAHLDFVAREDAGGGIHGVDHERAGVVVRLGEVKGRAE